MSELAVLRDLDSKPVDHNKYVFRRVMAAGIALGAFIMSSELAVNTFVSQKLECATAVPSDSAWDSGTAVAHQLEAMGVAVKDLREVTDLVPNANGGTEICGFAYSGPPLLTGVGSFTHFGENIHSANH